MNRYEPKNEYEIMRRRDTCSTCAHYGCCDDLHYCGGLRWTDAYGECSQCGHSVLLEDVEFEGEDGEVFCCEECYDNWMADNGDDDEGA